MQASMQSGNPNEGDNGSGHGNGYGNAGGNSKVANFVPGEIAVAVMPQDPTLKAKEIVKNLVMEQSPVQEDEVLRETMRHLARVTALSDKVALVITRLQGQDATEEAVLERITRLNQQLGPQGGRSIIALTPNWFSSSCPGVPNPGGGPGGQPVAPSSPPNKADYAFQLPNGFVTSGGGQGAVVAVLDTLPSELDLRQAYATWSENELIQKLMGTPTLFQRHPAGGMHLLQLVDYALTPHSYPMPDHGFFVSGVIRAIAENAEIHLIETLNSYGVGNLESVANAMRLVLALAGPSSTRPKPDDPVPPSAVVSLDDPSLQNPFAEKRILPESGLVTTLVVNCSFMFNARMHGKHHPRGPRDDQMEDAGRAFERIWQRLDPLLDPENPDARLLMFAAAGNDGDDDDVKDGDFPPARYPAAFNTVTGAGALNRDNSPAVYTDRCDRPTDAGFATLGGNVVDTVPQAGIATHEKHGKHYIADGEMGMLGVYSCPMFPDGTPNSNGWARWAGTSFAAPILSGAAALYLSAAGAKGSPWGAIDALRIASGGQRVSIGPVFPVTQN